MIHKKVLFSILITSVTLLVLIVPSFANAQLSGITDPTASKGFTLGGLIQNALPIIFGLVTFLAVVVFSIGALRYMSSRGDPKAAEGARGTMTGAVIGLVIVLGAASVSGVFETIFGISLFGGNNAVAPIDPSKNSFDLACSFQLVTGDCIGKSENYQSFGGLVGQILRLILAIGAVAFFFLLVWGGIRYMSSRGDEKAVAEARSTLTNAMVGLLLMISALVIIRLIAAILFQGSNFIG